MYVVVGLFFSPVQEICSMSPDVELVVQLFEILSETDLRVSSVQCGLPSPAESSFTPESCRKLVLRSSSLRLEEWELRTEARASQHLSVRL